MPGETLGKKRRDIPIFRAAKKPVNRPPHFPRQNYAHALDPMLNCDKEDHCYPQHNITLDPMG